MSYKILYNNQMVECSVCVYRKLTAQQKALILAYAETESGVDGTVSGIASTKDGTYDGADEIFL